MEARQQEAFRVFRQGVELKNEGKVAEATPIIARAIELNPGGRETDFQICYGECLLETGHADQAYNYWHDHVMHPELDPNITSSGPLMDIHAFQEYAQTAHLTHHPKEATWAKRQMIIALALREHRSDFTISDADIDAMTPRQRDALIETAAGREAQSDSGPDRDYKPALAHYRRAIALDPKQAWAYYFLGTALHEDYQEAQAVEAFRKAAELGSGRMRANAQTQISHMSYLTP